VQIDSRHFNFDRRHPEGPRLLQRAEGSRVQRCLAARNRALFIEDGDPYRA
jgi:hypothetical protein